MYRSPNLREYLVLKYSADTEQKLETAEEIFGGNADLREIDRYIAEIDEIRANNVNLQTPYYPDEQVETYYKCNSIDVKIVTDYTKLNFSEVYKLDILTFWAWLHDAVVWNCSQSKDGKDYLEKCRANSQQEPDRNAFSLFG